MIPSDTDFLDTWEVRPSLMPRAPSALVSGGPCEGAGVSSATPSSPEDVLIGLERGGGKESERETDVSVRDKHRLLASCN